MSNFHWVKLLRSDGSYYGDDSGRVRDCLLYACGRLGSVSVVDVILRMEDHKGELTVEITRSLHPDEQSAFRDAWEEPGCEPREHVYFTSLEDPKQDPLHLVAWPTKSPTAGQLRPGGY
jgi:hypothetical protein